MIAFYSRRENYLELELFIRKYGKNTLGGKDEVGSEIKFIEI